MQLVRMVLRLIVVGVPALTLLACGRGDERPSARATEVVSLTEGCHPVVLTWPAGTPLERVVVAVARPDVLEAIWRVDPTTETPAGYRPAEPGAATYARTLTDHDEVHVCMRAASVLQRPFRARAAPWPVAAADVGRAAPQLSRTAGDRAAPAPTPAGEVESAPAALEETRRKIGRPEPDVDPSMPFALLPPGSPLPKESRCASVVERSSWEPRPDNIEANNTRGTPLAEAPLPGLDAARVTGNFTGTTDEIIQWGACKWGWDPNIVRAIAVQESYWKQAAVGDHGTSYGLLQIKRTAHHGTYPASHKSTAFNVDYVLAWLRACYDGDFSYWLPASARGDEWGCVGTWYSGHFRDAGAHFYINLIKRHYAEKPWTTPRF